MRRESGAGWDVHCKLGEASEKHLGRDSWPEWSHLVFRPSLLALGLPGHVLRWLCALSQLGEEAVSSALATQTETARPRFCG